MNICTNTNVCVCPVLISLYEVYKISKSMESKGGILVTQVLGEAETRR